ncbi:hypothetical protein V9T40_008945 [Parthenolecanium corni]|uniref:CHK kinase-like domain-containing protein n=1 Tax=Parthenolecanium corni TaxID=536013 RepID=A0AAN9Y7N4_9HEMI
MNSLVKQEHLCTALKIATQRNEHNMEDDVTILDYNVSPKLGADNTSNSADVVTVQVNYEYQNVRKQRSFIFKIPFNHPHYEMFRSRGMYETETNMYKTVLPKLNSFLPEPISPECYLLADQDTLVVEDLAVSGYRNGAARLDFQHCVILFKTVAKFQAASYKLSLEDPNLLNKISRKQFYHSNAGTVMSDKMFPLCEVIMRKEFVSANSIKKLEALKDKLVAKSSSDTDNQKFDLNVISHCGLKSPNVMFLYDQSGQHPISAKLIDFQTCRWSSPVCDVIGVCGMTVQFSVFENKFSQLKKIYLESFNQWLTLLECDKKYEEDEFDADMENLVLFRIYVFFCQGYLGVQQILNVPNLTSVDWNDETVTKVTADAEFMQLFLGWVKYFQKIELL